MDAGKVKNSVFSISDPLNKYGHLILQIIQSSTQWTPNDRIHQYSYLC